MRGLRNRPPRRFSSRKDPRGDFASAGGTSPASFPIASLTPRLFVVRDVLQLQYHFRINPEGTCRAARPDKNLSQVLKNMDSLAGKSTVQGACHHFVSLFPEVQAHQSRKRR